MPAKRVIDLILSVSGLVFLSPVFALAAISILLTSGLPIIYKQERVGKNGNIFVLYKFRTMERSPKIRLKITPKNDKRITGVGLFLRKYKIDELPQLVNVAIGEMSLVGPRPEIPEFANYYKKEFERILTVRPGITDSSSIKFRDESAYLDNDKDPTEFYLNNILPEKISMNLEYVRNPNIFYDIKLIFKTLGALATKEKQEVK